MKNLEVIDMSGNNIQVTPAKELIVPVDTLNNTIFYSIPKELDRQFKDSIGQEEYDSMSEENIKSKIDEMFMGLLTQSQSFSFLEKEYCPKTGKTNSENVQFWLNVVGDCGEKLTGLSEQDRLILSACMAEQANGNSITTIDILHRNLGGVQAPKPEKIEEYLNSINKLMNIEIKIDAIHASQKLKQFHNGTLSALLVGRLLSCQFVQIKINGQLSKVAVQFLSASPLFTYAALKGHIAKIPSEVLIVPHSKNTWAFLQLKSYIYMRIKAIKKTRKYNKKFPAVLVVDTLFRHSGRIVKEKDYVLKKRMREQINLYLEFLQSCGVIKKFIWIDEKCKTHKNLKDCTKIAFAYQEDQSDSVPAKSEFLTWYDDWISHWLDD